MFTRTISRMRAKRRIWAAKVANKFEKIDFCNFTPLLYLRKFNFLRCWS